MLIANKKRIAMDQDERITNLEVKLSFSEDLVEELNQTVYKQQQQIDALIKEVKSLKLQMASNLPSEGINARDEIPPHY
jgi:SlyX protein